MLWGGVVKTILQGRKYFNGQGHCYGFKNTYNKNIIIKQKKILFILVSWLYSKSYLFMIQHAFELDITIQWSCDYTSQCIKLYNYNIIMQKNRGSLFNHLNL